MGISGFFETSRPEVQMLTALEIPVDSSFVKAIRFDPLRKELDVVMLAPGVQDPSKHGRYRYDLTRRWDGQPVTDGCSVAMAFAMTCMMTHVRHLQGLPRLTDDDSIGKAYNHWIKGTFVSTRLA
jgi:hypothetical protein